VITPDGRAIAVQADVDIAVRSLKGDTTVRTIATGEIETQPRVSPDGRWIAFVSGESGSEQVVVQPFPGPGARVQVSSNGGAEPVWSRDGRRLFYRANKKFMAATVTTAPAFAVRSRDVLFDDTFVPAAAPHANYDVSLDGKRLLVIEAVEGAEDAQMIIVVNWGAEVRARLRGRVPQSGR
jgi:serine/threonine-protein kinase